MKDHYHYSRRPDSNRRKLLLSILAFTLLAINLLVFRNLYYNNDSNTWTSSFQASQNIFSWPSRGNDCKELTYTAHQSDKKKSQNDVKILVNNGQWAHDEVLVPFIQTLASYKDINTTIAHKHYRWNIENIIDNIVTKEANLGGRKHTVYNQTKINYRFLKYEQYDILLDITCGDDFKVDGMLYEDLLAETNIFLYCVVHHAERLFHGTPLNNHLQPWAKQNRLRILTLSPHVTKNIEEQRSILAPVSTFIPVFSLKDDLYSKVEQNEKPFITIQGSFASKRRDYTQLFNDTAKYILGNNGKHNAKLLMIGSGDPPEIPTSIREVTDIDTDLTYPEYYSTLAQSSAILPAFASDSYYDERASSTVPASIIAGTPMVVTDALLRAYSYLPPNLTIKRKEGSESGIAAALGFFKQSSLMKSMVRTKLWRLRDTLILQNKSAFHQWVNADLTSDCMLR